VSQLACHEPFGHERGECKDDYAIGHDGERKELRAPAPDFPITLCSWVLVPEMPNSRPALNDASAAPTRTRLARSPVDAGQRLLAAAQVIESPETRRRYRIDRLIGAGGFGQAYLARRLGYSAHVPAVVCIKASKSIDGWLREAYFGQVLEGHPRAIRVYDAFPLMLPEGGGVLYCLALEYAIQGDLRAFLHRTGTGWPEATARREIAGILQVLGKLHRGQTLHRDLTPMNVFVCGRRCLKLGDFGIVRQQSDRRGIAAGSLNPLTAPSDILAGAAPKWQARDDVYQVGQLLGMLVKGDARVRVRSDEIRRLRCSDHLKEIVHRCIGERRKRYESADELIEALRRPPTRLKAGVLRTLKGVHLAFTGILSRRRSEAARMAKRAGAIVHGGPSALTTVVVRGRPNPLQAAGRDAGLKLMEIKRLRAKGQRITLLNDAQFWRLADPRARKS
jgi:serine/threonine-protein kinase